MTNTKKVQNKFLQCKLCHIFVLSQGATPSHHCKNGRRSRRNHHANTFCSVVFPSVAVTLQKLSPDANFESNFIPKQFKDKRIRKRRVGGLTEVLKSLGVESLADVQLTGAILPRKCSIDTKKKLHAMCKELQKNSTDTSIPSISTNTSLKKGRHKSVSNVDDGFVCSERESEDEDDDDEFTGQKLKIKRNTSTTSFVNRGKMHLMDSFYTQKCSKCTAKFQTEKELTIHVKCVHESGKNTIACPLCGREFGTRSNYQMHLNRHVNAESVENAFKLWEQWPIRNREGIKPQFACKFCLMRHHHHHSFLTHMKDQHTDKTKDSSFPCPYSCDMNAESIRLFVDHVKTNHSEKYFTKGSATKSLRFSYEQTWRDLSTKKDVYRYRSKCHICGKIFSSGYIQTHLESHQKVKIAKPFSCAICSIGLKDRYNLRRHFMIHLENNPFICRFPGCNQKFQDEYYLQKHVDRHVGSNFKTCQECGVTYKDINQSVHSCSSEPNKVNTRADGLLYAKTCRVGVNPDFQIPTGLAAMGLVPSTVENHAASKSISRENIKVENKDHIRRIEIESVHLVDKIVETTNGPIHIKGERLSPIREINVPVNSNQPDVTSPEPSNSDHSNEPNASKLTLRDTTLLDLIVKDPVYQRIIKEKPEFKEAILGRSMIYSIPKTKFPCDKCGLVFSRYFSLNLHKCKLAKKEKLDQAMEVNERDHCEIKIMCGACGYQATSGDDMKRHMKTAPDHGKNKKYRCTYKSCGLSFHTAVQLKMHITRIHLSVKNYHCNVCDKSFSTKSALRKHNFGWHSNVTDGEKSQSFKCSKCNLKYSSKPALQRHKKQVHLNTNELKKFKCQICGDELATRHTLRRHIVLVHTDKGRALKPSDIADDAVPSNGDNANNVSTPIGQPRGNRDKLSEDNDVDIGDGIAILGF